MLFISPQKLFSFSRYLSFCLDFWVMYRKGLIKKINVNLKFYDVTDWLTNSCNTHIAQYFESSDLVLMFACNNFPFRAFVTMIYRTSTEVLLILLLHWIQLCPLLTLSKSMFFELPVLIPLVLYLIRSVSAEDYLNCISRIRFRCSLF